MAPLVCSLCGKRPQGRLANFYWAKFNGGNDREAWKQRYCRQCFERDIEGFFTTQVKKIDADEPVTCIACDEGSPEHMVSFFLTAYVPNEAAERLGIDVCLDHVQVYEPLIRRGAEMLIDRQADPVEPARARW